SLIREIDSTLIGLVKKNFLGSNDLLKLERCLFSCVNSYYQLIEYVKKSFPDKNDLPHSRLIQMLSFLIENKQGYKTFTKLRNYIQHFSNVPFYLSYSDGKPKILINKDVLSEDKRISYSFDKELNSGFDFDLLNLTYDFIEEASKVVNYIFYIISKEIIEDVNSYISYFGDKNVKSRKMLLVHIERGGKVQDYYPCPQESVIELQRIYHSELHRKLFDFIEEEIISSQMDEESPSMKEDFIRELGVKEGTKKYNEFMREISMPPHVFETWNNNLTYDDPQSAKKAKIEKVKKIRRLGLFNYISIS
ncbi:hypothetical protein, partial [Photobacterium kasasachensis]|uniref:hypothetical protein n=1 Tax=Photobacterium kasasachensis TaxID=2910240 RepID=UPI003D0962D2